MAADTNDNSTSLFELDGREYEIPDWTDVDIDEWEIIYDECEVAVSDFTKSDDPEREKERLKRIRNPRLEKAFIMVALRRERPDDDLDMLRAEAGKTKLIPYLLRSGEEEPENPTQATKPERSSRKSSDFSNGSSSQDSSENSETPEDQPATIGTDG